MKKVRNFLILFFSSLIINSVALAGVCKTVPWAGNIRAVQAARKKVQSLHIEIDDLQSLINEITPKLLTSSASVEDLTQDLSVYQTLRDSLQNELDQIEQTTAVLEDLAKDCKECLILEDVFRYAKDDLPEEAWPTLETLEAIIIQRDKLVSAKQKRMEQSPKKFASTDLIDDLEKALVEITEKTDQKSEDLDAAKIEHGTIKASYDETHSKIAHRQNEIKNQETLIRNTQALINELRKEKIHCGAGGQYL